MEGYQCPNCSSLIRFDSLRCRICGHRLRLSESATGVNNAPLDVRTLSDLEIAEIRKEYSKKQPGEIRSPSAESMREVLAEAKVRKFKRYANVTIVLILCTGFIAWAIHNKSTTPVTGAGNSIQNVAPQSDQNSKAPVPLTDCQRLNNELKTLRNNSKNAYKGYIGKYDFFVKKKKSVVSGQDSQDLQKYFKDTFNANINLQKSYVKELQTAHQLPKCWRAKTFSEIEMGIVAYQGIVDYLSNYAKTDIFKLMVWSEASSSDNTMFSREPFKEVVFKYHNQGFLAKN